MLIFIVFVVLVFSCGLSIFVYMIYKRFKNKSEEVNMEKEKMYEMKLLDYTEQQNEKVERELEMQFIDTKNRTRGADSLRKKSSYTNGGLNLGSSSINKDRFQNVITTKSGKKVRVIAVPKLRDQVDHFIEQKRIPKPDLILTPPPSIRKETSEYGLSHKFTSNFNIATQKENRPELISEILTDQNNQRLENTHESITNVVDIQSFTKKPLESSNKPNKKLKRKIVKRVLKKVKVKREEKEK